MLKEFNWISDGNYYSKRAGEYEVTVQEIPYGYLVALWKWEPNELIEDQNFLGTDLNTLLRCLALADQLLKQNKKS